MSKRQFRKSKQPTAAESPAYPTFDSGRRQFLTRLGAVVVGFGAGASLLSACGGGRPISAQPDVGGPQGVAPLPDAEIDPDSGIEQPPDGMEIGGAAPLPDAEIDKPDAGVPESDLQAAPGYAPLMDAAVDGECPNP